MHIRQGRYTSKERGGSDNRLTASFYQSSRTVQDTRINRDTDRALQKSKKTPTASFILSEGDFYHNASRVLHNILVYTNSPSRDLAIKKKKLRELHKRESTSVFIVKVIESVHTFLPIFRRTNGFSGVKTY